MNPPLKIVYLRGAEAKRPQGIVYGERRRAPDRANNVGHAVLEPLQVIAASATQKFTTTTDPWGPFQLVLPPGDFEVWVERREKPVAEKRVVHVENGADVRIQLQAEYQMGTGRTLASVRSARLDRIATCARLLCVLTLFAMPTAAQSTTEDGIRAMLRGDKAAVAILRPLAQDAGRPDPTAQFFLAVLYETGHGVKVDMARACGLFARSALRDHPFAEQSAAIARNMRDQLGDGASMLCVANETWLGGPPQSIDLGPDHHITFTDTSVVVTHAEQETRTLWMFPPRPSCSRSSTRRSMSAGPSLCDDTFSNSFNGRPTRARIRLRGRSPGR